MSPRSEHQGLSDFSDQEIEERIEAANAKTLNGAALKIAKNPHATTSLDYLSLSI